jgi:DNA polymerase IV
VVAPPHSERAPILSVSTEARKEGIFKGMTLNNAVKFCPDLIALPHNPGLTEKGSRLLIRAVMQYTPVWEPSRPGHVYMDVTGTQRLWGRAKDTASRIRREIKESLSLSGAVGVGGNKMISDIASRLLPSEGVLDVDHGKESAFMAPLKVDYLPGVGHVRKRLLLEELNISLVRQIAILDMGSLKMIFGREAWVIHQRSIGIDLRPVHPPASKPAVSESFTLPSDENDDHKLLGILYSLTEKCSQRLRNRGLLAEKAGLTIRYSDQIEVTRQASLPRGSFCDNDLYSVLEDLYFKACQRRTGIRFMRVWFRNLTAPSSQLSLFPEIDPDGKKKTMIDGALDCIRKKHGYGAIGYGRAA